MYITVAILALATVRTSHIHSQDLMAHRGVRGTDSGIMLSQPTLHEMRAQRRHQARLKTFGGMREEMKQLVAMEVRDVVYQTLYGEQGKLHTPIISEIVLRAGLGEKAGRGFSHSHPAYRWAHANLPACEARQYRQAVRSRNAAARWAGHEAGHEQAAKEERKATEAAEDEKAVKEERKATEADEEEKAAEEERKATGAAEKRKAAE